MGIAVDSRRLRVFVEVVRQGGFSRAAKRLHATQPTVSKAVQQLESELRVRLLDRMGRRIALTAAGELVYRRAVTLLAQSDDLLTDLAELRGLKSGVLRIGFPRLGASALFARMIALFRRRYPGIEVAVGVHSGQKMRELVRSGELDLGVLGKSARRPGRRVPHEESGPSDEPSVLAPLDDELADPALVPALEPPPERASRAVDVGRAAVADVTHRLRVAEQLEQRLRVLDPGPAQDEPLSLEQAEP